MGDQSMKTIVVLTLIVLTLCVILVPSAYADQVVSRF